MPEFFKKFDNAVMYIPNTEYVYDGKSYFIDTIIKTSYYKPGADYSEETPTVQIMVDLAAMTNQLWLKYPDLADAAGFNANADSSMFPGTEDAGFAMFPYIEAIN